VHAGQVIQDSASAGTFCPSGSRVARSRSSGLFPSGHVTIQMCVPSHPHLQVPVPAYPDTVDGQWRRVDVSSNVMQLPAGYSQTGIDRSRQRSPIRLESANPIFTPAMYFTSPTSPSKLNISDFRVESQRSGYPTSSCSFSRQIHHTASP